MSRNAEPRHMATVRAPIAPDERAADRLLTRALPVYATETERMITRFSATS